jgi:hypothetical protein
MLFDPLQKDVDEAMSTTGESDVLLGRNWLRIDMTRIKFWKGKNKKCVPVIYQSPKWYPLVYDMNEEVQGKILLSYMLYREEYSPQVEDMMPRDLVPNGMRIKLALRTVGLRNYSFKGADDSSEYFYQMRVSGKITEPFVDPQAEVRDIVKITEPFVDPRVEVRDIDSDDPEERAFLGGQDNGDDDLYIKYNKSVVSKAAAKEPVAKKKTQKIPAPTDKPEEIAKEKQKDEKIIYVSHSRTITEAQKAKNNAEEKNTKVYKALVDMRYINSVKEENKYIKLGGFNSNATLEFEVDVPYNRALCPVLEFYLWNRGFDEKGKKVTKPFLVGMSSIPLKKQLSFVYHTTEDDAYVKMWKKYL